MTFNDFKNSLDQPHPPESISPALQALWYEATGDWEKAHVTVQSEGHGDGAWVHAYLHRREGDIGNAGYWYSMAGKPKASGDLDSEWEQISRALLED